MAERETSRFPGKERSYMPVSKTTPGRPGTRDDAPVRAAFRLTHNVGTREKSSFAAQWLAYTTPYRRFAGALAGNNARLGANVGRYPFIVTDFHRSFLADNPAHEP
jgi:hypothetical protein